MCRNPVRGDRPGINERTARQPTEGSQASLPRGDQGLVRNVQSQTPVPFPRGPGGGGLPGGSRPLSWVFIRVRGAEGCRKRFPEQESWALVSEVARSPSFFTAERVYVSRFLRPFTHCRTAWTVCRVNRTHGEGQLLRDSTPTRNLKASGARRRGVERVAGGRMGGAGRRVQRVRL